MKRQAWWQGGMGEKRPSGRNILHWISISLSPEAGCVSGSKDLAGEKAGLRGYRGMVGWEKEGPAAGKLADGPLVPSALKQTVLGVQGSQRSQDRLGCRMGWGKESQQQEHTPLDDQKIWELVGVRFCPSGKVPKSGQIF